MKFRWVFIFLCRLWLNNLTWLVPSISSLPYVIIWNNYNWLKNWIEYINQIRQSFLLPKLLQCGICIDKLDMFCRLHVWMHFANHWPELRSICATVLFYSTCCGCNIYLIMWECCCRIILLCYASTTCFQEHFLLATLECSLYRFPGPSSCVLGVFSFYTYNTWFHQHGCKWNKDILPVLY